MDVTRAMERVVGWAACVGALVLLAWALLTGVEARAAATLAATGATVQLAAVPGRPAAGYLTLSGGPAVLTGVTSSVAARVELHESTTAGGMSRMAMTLAVPVPAAGAVRFAPGGRHLMIFGLKAPAVGATVPLVLHFEDGRSLQVAARAVAPGMAAMEHGGH